MILAESGSQNFEVRNSPQKIPVRYFADHRSVWHRTHGENMNVTAGEQQQLKHTRLRVR